MHMKQQGAAPVDLILWASSWYGARPDPQLSPATTLSAVGNEFYGTAPAGDPATERLLFEAAPTEATLGRRCSGAHGTDAIKRGQIVLAARAALAVAAPT